MGLLQRSLSARLLTYFLLLVVITTAVIGYVAYNSGRQSIVNHVEAHMESVATLKQQQVELWVEHLKHGITWLAVNPQVRSDATVLTTSTIDEPEYLAAYESIVSEFSRMAVLGDFSAVFLLDSTSGKTIASSDVSSEGKFREGEQYFIQGKTDTYVSDLFYSLTLSQPTMVVSYPVKDNYGKLLGVLAAHVNLEPLNELMLERSGLGETGETYLVRESNLLLTDLHTLPGVAFNKWVFTEGVNRALKGESGVDLYLDYREKPVIGSYHWLEEMKLALLVEFDQEEALAPVNRLRNTIVMIAGIVFIIAAAIGWLMVRQITNPLTRLADYARRVEKGELTAELEIKGKDEVASVSSDVKTMVGQLVQMQGKLLESERLATLGQFSGNISHELRNPLGVIDSSAYYLKTKLKDADAKVHEHLDRIKASVVSSTTIIESLLNLTRMEEPRLTRVDLAAAAADAITTSKIPAAVKVIRNFPEEEVPVNADREQLRIAFKNIIKNAHEAMEGKGTLTVTVGRTADGQAEVSFADTGSGIAMEDLEKVFQPLFSRKAKGIGFGLSITRMVADKHGGRIEAKSELGTGANIIMQLPLYIDKVDKDKEV